MLSALRVLLTLGLCVSVIQHLSASDPIRIGDAASVPDPTRFDPAYPEMKTWAEAGVRGGIPPRSTSGIVEQLQPGDNIQQALDRARTLAKKKGMVPEKISTMVINQYISAMS